MKKHIHQDPYQRHKSAGAIDVLKENTQWGWANEPIRPSIKLLLLLPLGFGITMIWSTLTHEPELAGGEQGVELSSAVLNGLFLLFLLTIFIVFPTYLIAGNTVRSYLRPIFMYFHTRWKYLVFSMLGASLLYALGVFSSIEAIIAEPMDAVPSALHFVLGIALVILLGEASAQIGKGVFYIFSMGRKKDQL